ncbi:LuxR C-terminal-related transcriptional regulator [Kitasatospora gansuensis]
MPDSRERVPGRSGRRKHRGGRQLVGPARPGRQRGQRHRRGGDRLAAVRRRQLVPQTGPATGRARRVRRSGRHPAARRPGTRESPVPPVVDPEPGVDHGGRWGHHARRQTGPRRGRHRHGPGPVRRRGHGQLRRGPPRQSQRRTASPRRAGRPGAGAGRTGHGRRRGRVGPLRSRSPGRRHGGVHRTRDGAARRGDRHRRGRAATHFHAPSAIACRNATTPLLQLTAPLAELTGRERDVALLAANGFTSPAIGHRLGLSARTVDNTLGRTYQKLGVTSRRDLAPLVVGDRP